MKFSESVSGSGLVEEIDFLCHSDSNSYPINDKTRHVNDWYFDVVTWIRSVKGNWQWDDLNQTTLPIYTNDLVAGQQDYEIDDATTEVERVEVMDNDGDYNELTPIDKEQIGEAMSEYKSTNALPEEYDIVGRSILLYPAPAAAYVTTTAGMKVYVSRKPDIFTTGDTTQEPGFAPNFHRVLALGAAYDFEEDPGKRARLMEQIKDYERKIKEFYTSRHKSYKTTISPRRESYQ